MLYVAGDEVRGRTGARCGLGWDIAEYDEAGVPTIKGRYERDESEQVRYLQEMNQIFVEEGLDLAFWFTFAGYHMPPSSDPHRDADLASYGLVSLLPEGPARGSNSRLPRPGKPASPRGGAGRVPSRPGRTARGSRARRTAR
jgi:hypothetical protein